MNRLSAGLKVAHCSTFQRTRPITLLRTHKNMSTVGINIGSRPEDEARAVGSRVKKFLTVENLNPRVVEAEYAVRGELVIRAEEHQKTLKEQQTSGVRKLPFDDLVFCNIGNPQSLQQKPLTFFRQYLSLMENPDLLKEPLIEKIYPADVIRRAKDRISKFPGTGAYSHSKGLPFVRNAIAQFLHKRDGIPANPEDLYLYNGASPAVQNALRLFVKGEEDGIMIPIPQYPLYSASIKLLGGTQLGYYLDEEKEWSTDISELERVYNDSVSRGVTPRALVVINPGNPTGQVLSEASMQAAIRFCQEKKVVLMADEVYQENVYIKKDRPFNSFKKLFSFHSISKGFLGECGHRCGYVEITNVDEEVKAQMYKLSSILLCPNTSGQLLMECMVDPPKEGDESHSLYVKERDDIYDSLKRRAQKLTNFLNTLEGVTCNSAEGAMYAFPQIRLPDKAVAAAKKVGKKPDDFYAIRLLDAAGVVVVPGSGFGQKDNTLHFRTTFLPPESQIEGVMKRLGEFHK
ncbi:alanine transaminase, partial [Planoprotostelium fungivorum]